MTFSHFHFVLSTLWHTCTDLRVSTWRHFTTLHVDDFCITWHSTACHHFSSLTTQCTRRSLTCVHFLQCSLHDTTTSVRFPACSLPCVWRSAVKCNEVYRSNLKLTNRKFVGALSVRKLYSVSKSGCKWSRVAKSEAKRWEAVGSNRRALGSAASDDVHSRSQVLRKIFYRIHTAWCLAAEKCTCKGPSNSVYKLILRWFYADFKSKIWF